MLPPLMPFGVHSIGGSLGSGAMQVSTYTGNDHYDKYEPRLHVYDSISERAESVAIGGKTMPDISGRKEKV